MAEEKNTLTFLVYGDPHFKGDNKQETDLMEIQSKELILKLNPDFVVVLGDILHTHEKVDLLANTRATSFLRTLKSVSKHLYVLIGNHDLQGDKDFLSGNHVFNSLKEWDRTTLVDDVIIHEHKVGNGVAKFCFSPYTPVTRLAEALKTKGLEAPYPDITCLFAHQEFKGCQMGAIKSTNGDEWAPENPLCVSGHIHEFDKLKDNMIYCGTPIQSNYGDKGFKSISLFTFGNFEGKRGSLINHEHIVLDIPKRLNLHMNVDELIEYAKIIPNPRDKIKIKIKDGIIKIQHALLTENVIRLKNAGVILIPIDTTESAAKLIPQNVRTKIAFQKRLGYAIESLTNPAMKAEFYELFPNMQNMQPQVTLKIAN